MASLINFASVSLSMEDKLKAINEYRSNYTWSTKIYTPDNIADVYFIRHENNIVGFVEVEYENLDFSLPSEVCIFIKDIHISPKMQGKSIGYIIIAKILKKIPLIKMIVVNDNEKMIKLVNKFKVLSGDKGENVTLYKISNET